MWREKAIRWGWITAGLNALIAVMNMYFLYGHYIKHEYWTMVFSGFLIIMNGWVAWWQFKNVMKYKQELKELMWKTLSSPSEVLKWH